MRKVGLSLLILLIVMVGLIGRSETAEPSKTTWRLGHYFPTTDLRGILAQQFADLITKKTNGRIEVKVYPNSQLVKGAEVFRALSANVHQISLIPAGYVTGEIPVAEFWSLPFSPWQDFETVNRIVNVTFDIWSAEYARNNAKYLGQGCSSISAANLYAKTPIRKVSDLAGKKMRSSGRSVDTAFRAVKASPVNMAASEQYMALQTGTIDGVVTGPGSVTSYKLYEVAPYWSEIPFVMPPYSWAVNLEEWNKLTPELQQIVLDAKKEMDQTTAAAEKIEKKEEEHEIAAKVKERIQWPNSEVNLWRTQIQSLYADFFKKHGKNGSTLEKLWEDGTKGIWPK